MPQECSAEWEKRTNFYTAPSPSNCVGKEKVVILKYEGDGLFSSVESAERVIPEVQRAMEELSNVVERYGNLVDHLRNRLSEVTSPPPPLDRCTESVPERGYCVGLAIAIDDSRRKLRNITDGLEDLCQRIEL